METGSPFSIDEWMNIKHRQFTAARRMTSGELVSALNGIDTVLGNTRERPFESVVRLATMASSLSVELDSRIPA